MKKAYVKIMSSMLAMLMVLLCIPVIRKNVSAVTTAQLVAPENLRWDGNVARWDAVPHADSYEVRLLEANMQGDTNQYSCILLEFRTIHDTSLDVAKWFKEGERTYCFSVIALSPDYSPSEEVNSPVRTFKRVFPTIKNVKITDRGVLNWDPVASAVRYEIELQNASDIDNADAIVEDHSVDLISLLNVNGASNGTYNIRIIAWAEDDFYGSVQLSSWKGTYTFKDAQPRLETASNLKWDGSKATWDAVAHAEKYDVELLIDNSSKNTISVITGRSVDFSDSFDEGEHVYSFKVVAKATGYTDSEPAVGPEKTFKTSFPDLKNVKISSEGLMTWDAFPKAVRYEFTIGTGGGTVEETHLDLAETIKDFRYDAGTYNISLYAVDINNRRVSPIWTGSYTYETHSAAFDDFVERLYVVAMNRESDPEGKAFWVEKVQNGEYNGADCARFFLLTAPEFMNRKLDDSAFLEVLYNTFYDRDSDQGGKTYWMGRLKDGTTRETVVNDFIESTEWCNVCATYGIRSGAVSHKSEIASQKATKFATRLYTCCLGRAPEEKGLQYWSLALTNLEQTGCSAANLFFTGEEFEGFGTLDDEYVRRLYKTFMDRVPQESEVSFWTGEIAKGTQTRASVLAFFGGCEEFTNICKSYGIERG